MHWKMIMAILLFGMIMGAVSSLAWQMMQGEPSHSPPPPGPSRSPEPPSPDAAFLSDDPALLDGDLPPPPQSLPSMSAGLPPTSFPNGELPPLPLPGGGPMPPWQATEPVAAAADPEAISTPAPPPVQRLTPPKGHARIEKEIRKITGVSSLAWGENKKLYVLVQNASPASVARAACSRANAVASGVHLHVQSVSNPNEKSAQRRC